MLSCGRHGFRLRQAGAVAVTLLSLAFVLAGCASRPEVGALLSNHAVSAVGKDHTILVATTRERDSRPGTYFGVPDLRLGAEIMALTQKLETNGSSQRC